MIEEQILEENLNIFKSDLIRHTALEIVQKKIIFGNCVILNDEKYLNLRIEVAREFKIHPNDVLVVGSAKLGFSIAPKKRYNFFHNESDIDIAIVSEKLFGKIWLDVLEFKKQKTFWDNKKFEEFKNFLFHGWIRPDKLPQSNLFELSKKWWDFFLKKTSSNSYGPYKIRGALYKNWEFLENYQISSVQKCIDEEELKK